MSMTFAERNEFNQMKTDIEELKKTVAARDKRISRMEGSVKRLILGTTCEHDEGDIPVPARPECLDLEGFSNNPKAQDQYDTLMDPEEGDANVR